MGDRLPAPEPTPLALADPLPPARPAARPGYQYLDLVMAAFVAALLCSALIGVGKVTQVNGFTFGAAILFFPISYLINDVLTEVYGYARARRVVWMGFGAMAYASVMAYVVLALPAAPGWAHQAAYETVYGSTPRIVLGSLLAFWAGELVNSYTLAKMKVATAGRHLWARTIGSTAVGEVVDTAIFYPVAFLGVWSPELLVAVMVGNYAMKVGWEVVMTPVTYAVVGWLKRAEGEDWYDRDTDFSPFTLQTRS